MQKRQYWLALACWLAIPAVFVVEAGVFQLLDPELAQRFGDYVHNYRLIETARQLTIVGTIGVAGILWLATCHFVLAAKQRSSGWLLLAVCGPLGFSLIAMLGDFAPAPADCYQRFVGRLKQRWRIPFEIGLFFAVWVLAFETMLLRHGVAIRLESITTGTPVATIIERQEAESGMRSFGEGLEVMYLVVLIYLLWPIVFNLVCGFRNRQATLTSG